MRLENQSASLNSTLLLENQLQNVDKKINEIQSQILQTRLLVDYSTMTLTLNRVTVTQAPLSLKLTATPKSGTTPLAVTFNAIVSGGNAPYIVNYNFDDGTSFQGQALIHAFKPAGNIQCDGNCN